MAKTQEELNALKEEVETLNNKLKELTEEELAQVSGGLVPIPNWMGEYYQPYWRFLLRRTTNR